MSSTNRGYSRHKSDYYVTPVNEIKQFLISWFGDESLSDDWNTLTERPDKLRWLDPCAGGDANNPMSYPEALEVAGVYPDTMDIREDSLARWKASYLDIKSTKNRYDVIITNPPFYLAMDIIKKSLADVKDGGYVVMLLRLNFLGSKGRKEFWDNNPPKKIYVHHKRMSFTENGATDSIEYAHFVWQKGFKGETKIEVI